MKWPMVLVLAVMPLLLSSCITPSFGRHMYLPSKNDAQIRILAFISPMSAPDPEGLRMRQFELRVSIYNVPDNKRLYFLRTKIESVNLVDFNAKLLPNQNIILWLTERHGSRAWEFEFAPNPQKRGRYEMVRQEDNAQLN